ncbi:MATE family efflux transporter [Kytococcus sp. Marseille-QA3725]
MSPTAAAAPRTWSQSREILALAVPAFFALIAEPLFLMLDTAMVGRVSTSALAGMGVATAALGTAVGVFVFLAYGTTAVVSRRLGAGNVRGALAAGVDGVWLAVLLGAVTAAVTALLAHPLAGLFGASGDATEQAATYLRISALGIPPMLVVLAVTGVLRGLQDTRSPLVAATVGFAVNAALNATFIFVLGWGIAGAAWGTVIAQAGMAAGLVLLLLHHVRQHDAPTSFTPAGVLTAALGGVPLLVRTLALRGVMLLTTWLAAGLGDVPLAAHQVAMTVWGFLAFALDALAIAAQALTGRALGAGDVTGTRSATRTMTWWGVGFGVVTGVLLVALSGVLPALFTEDPAVQRALVTALVVAGLVQPVAGIVFVLDGVLIGAGDARWLAWAQVAVLVGYLPLVWVVQRYVPAGVSAPDAMWWLWGAFAAFMVMRCIALVWRARGEAWMVTGE